MISDGEMIQVKNLSKRYVQGEHQTDALLSVSANFGKSGFVAVVGESGSGKSTFLNMLAALDWPTEGSVELFGENVSEYTDAEKEQFYFSKVGIIFQDFCVFDTLTIEENLDLCAEKVNADKSDLEAEKKHVLERLGIFDIRYKKINELSGGQKQRVAIARALIKHPVFLLADEPTGNLDEENSGNVFEILKEVSGEILVICVTHDFRKAQQYADRIIRLNYGKISQNLECREQSAKYWIEMNGKRFSIESLSEIPEHLTEEAFDGKNELQISVKRIVSSDEKLRESKEQRKEYESKPISGRAAVGISDKILQKHNRRSRVYAVLSVILAFLFLCLFVTASFSGNRAVKGYMTEYASERTLISKDYNDELTGETYNIKISLELIDALKKSGLTYGFYLEDAVLSNCDLSGSVDEMGMFPENRTETAVREFIMPENADLSENGIILTDVLAESFGVGIGDVIYLNSEEYTVEKIEQTEEKNSKVTEVTTDDEQEEYLRTSLSQYVIILAKKSCSETVNIPGNFTAHSNFDYVYNHLEYASGGGLSENLVSGRLPETENEIVVSENFIWNNDLNENEVIGTTYTLRDIYDGKFYHKYDEYSNVYDYLGSSVTVVGITDGESDVYVSDSVFQMLREDGNSLNVSGIFLEGNGSKKYSFISENGCKVDNPFLDGVYRAQDFVDSLRIIFWIISLLVFCAILLVFYISISYAIKDNARAIGILKVLGYSKKDIRRIFSVNPTQMLLISEGLAGMLLAVLCKGINVFIANSYYRLREFSVLVPNVPVILLVMAVTFAIGMIFVWIPLRQIDSVTVKDTLRS